MSRIEVVRGTKVGRGRTSKSKRLQVFNREEAIMARCVLPAGGVATWHHHGSRELLGFLVRGKLRLECRSKKTSVDLFPGDFFRIPRRLIHRDMNLSKSNLVVVVSMYVGKGPVAVNVEENSEGSSKTVDNSRED